MDFDYEKVLTIPEGAMDAHHTQLKLEAGSREMADVYATDKYYTFINGKYTKLISEHLALTVKAEGEIKTSSF